LVLLQVNINKLSELIVQEAGGSVAAMVALCSCILDLSAEGFSQDFSTKSTAEVMQDVYQIIFLHLESAVQAVFTALEPFRSSVDIPSPPRAAGSLCGTQQQQQRRRRRPGTAVQQHP
jgi:hypothetical protein